MKNTGTFSDIVSAQGYVIMMFCFSAVTYAVSKYFF